MYPNPGGPLYMCDSAQCSDFTNTSPWLAETKSSSDYCSRSMFISENRKFIEIINPQSLTL